MPAVIPAMNVRAHHSHGLAALFVSFMVVSVVCLEACAMLSVCALRDCSLSS